MKHHRLAVLIAAVTLVMDILDLTIVNVAIPSLRGFFGADGAVAQWMVAGYATVFAILLATGGRMGDIYGYRRMLMIGMAGFVLASLGCGVAQEARQLIAARLLQGGAAALMLPQVMSLVQILYPPHKRVAILSVFGVLGGAAAVTGPVLGGLIIGADLFGLGWRPIFLINLPVGLLALALAPLCLPTGGSPHAPRLDLPGMALSAMAVLAVMLPLIQGPDLGWPLWCWLSLAAAPLLVLLLARYSRWKMRRDGSALIVPALFQVPAFAHGLAVIVSFEAAVSGLLFTLSLLLQQGLGMSPAQAGLAHVPYAIGASVGIAGLTRRILPKLGARLLGVGALVMGSGVAVLLALLALVPAGLLTPLTLAPVLLAMGLGMGLVVGPLSPLALSEVDTGHAGAASGLLKTVQQLGGAFGVAAAGGLFFRAGFAASALIVFSGLFLVVALSRRFPDAPKLRAG